MRTRAGARNSGAPWSSKPQKLWGSMVKQTLKRRRPGFNERFYGVRSFGDLLEEAENRGLLKLELDERSGGYVIKALTPDR